MIKFPSPRLTIFCFVCYFHNEIINLSLWPLHPPSLAPISKQLTHRHTSYVDTRSPQIKWEKQNTKKKQISYTYPMHIQPTKIMHKYLPNLFACYFILLHLSSSFTFTMRNVCVFVCVSANKFQWPIARQSNSHTTAKNQLYIKLPLTVKRILFHCPPITQKAFVFKRKKRKKIEKLLITKYIVEMMAIFNIFSLNPINFAR